MDYLHLAIIGLPILFFSLTVHEFSHAWSANRLGDPTAKELGRLSLNPLVHIDISGLMVMVISGFRFGWAKPVPINPFNFRDWRRGTFLVSVAGPVSNLMLAVLASLIFHLAAYAGLDAATQNAVQQFFYFMILINCALAFFNLIPLPPLDGSQMLISLLPPRYENFTVSLQKYGPMILYGVIILGFLMPGGRSFIWMVIGPFVDLTMTILIGK